MPSYVPYLALAIFPVVVSIPFDLRSFMWGWMYPFAPMPAELAQRAEKFRRYSAFLHDALTVVLVLLLGSYAHITASQMGMNRISWQRHLLVGCAMAVLWVGLQWIVKGFLRGNTGKTRSQFFRGGSALLWVFIFLSGAFAEEIWRSLCIVTLRNGGHRSAFVVLITAVVFTIAHIWEGPFRALGRFPFGVAAALVFIWTGSLLTTYFFHLIPNLAWTFWTRRE